MPLSRPQSNLLRTYMESPSFESLGHTLTRLLHSENRAGAHDAIQQHLATNNNNFTHGVPVNEFVEEVLEMWQAHCDVDDLHGQFAALSLEEATQGGDQNCSTIEEEGDGEGDVLESGASTTEGEGNEEEHTDAELNANVESDDMASETDTIVEDGGASYDPDESVEDEDTDAELDANSEDEDTDAELDANSEDEDTDAELDANAEDEDTDAELDANAKDEDTDAELDVNSEDEDSVSGPGENVESEDTDSEPDSNVGDEDVAPHLSLEQPAGSQHANDGGRGMMRKASNTQLPRPHRFAASNPRRGGGPMRFVTSGLLWIWSNSFFLGPLMIIVGPRIWQVSWAGFEVLAAPRDRPLDLF
ncbi:hypothetical protein NA56DRAFT_450219 [Hyaloscypha hepaticicola]|uniref:Uncharacterized protein n=1 Tax=Hyaloscypha hepaticicola TaxID=2082293 RepID=A0A2J6PFY4_9HELO|nr:hypothetical protein NA56DRAFT_450219 [Hyaloscypha hepaticicola]